jgi:hypothetical protein
MSAAAHCQLVGRWRIVEADLGDRDYLSLQAAVIAIGADSRGEIAFGALSPSNTATATKPFSRRNARLFQQPARASGS